MIFEWKFFSVGFVADNLTCCGLVVLKELNENFTVIQTNDIMGWKVKEQYYFFSRIKEVRKKLKN